MKFTALDLPGTFLVDLEPITDNRGHFARTFCHDEFREHGLDPMVAQCNVSWNHRKGTLRGMHYQSDPHGEAKLVRCTRGAIFDVLIDLRPESTAYCTWTAHELTADGPHMLFAPTGVAHGFLTLADATEVHYQMSAPYVQDAASGVRWDDPAFAIDWPAAIEVISERDAGYPDFRP